MAFVQGEHHWNGAEMARDEINKAGGINVGGKRMQIELVRADTNEIQSVPDATNAVERVITRDKVDFLIGGFRSEAVLAMQEVAMDYKKLFLGVGAAHSKLGLNVEQNYERYKYWFRVSPTKDVDLARTLFAVMGSIGQQIRNDLKTDTPKVAILAEKAVWTEGLVAAAQKNLPALKMEVVGLWQPSAVATDVTAELSAIDRAGAHIVFTMLSGPVGISVGRQMGERNMKAVAWGINVEGQKEEFWQAAAGKAQFVSTLDTYAEVEYTPKTIAVRARLQGALQEGADLHRGHLRRDHDAEGRDREGRHHQRRQDRRPHREGRARRHRRRRHLRQAPRPRLGGGQDLRHRGAVAGRQEGAVLAAQVKGMQPFKMPAR